METINFFWSKPELPELAITCLKSFQEHGHACRMWSYSDINNLPEAVEQGDANKIIPFNKTISIRQFIDIFRLKMLIAVGGWWSDLDNICIRPLDFMQDYVFAGFWKETVNNNIMKAPKDSQLLQSFINSSPDKYNFSSLYKHIVSNELKDSIMPVDYFNPLRVNLTGEITVNTYVIHTYNSNNLFLNINQKISEIMAKEKRKTQSFNGTTDISGVACPFNVDAENVVITYNKHFNLQYKLNKKTKKIDLVSNDGKEPDFAAIKAEIEAELKDINEEYKF